MKACLGVIVSVSSVMSLIPAVALAQGASAIEEVVVTAQKRAETVNTVPITMSVLTAKALVSGGVRGTKDLEFATPGLVFGDTNGFAQPFMRGIGTDLIGTGQESPVGFYVDGIYTPFQTTMTQEFGDIQRIEVLKGPQGTLYGRNTTGGAINVITRDPNQEYSANVSVSYGSHNFAKGVAFAEGGLAPNLAASISAVATRHDGFFKVINTGDKLDNLAQWGLRGKVKFEPNDVWTFKLGADFLHKNDSKASVFTALVGNNLGITPPGFGPSFTPYETYTDLEPHSHRKARLWGVNLTARGDFGGTELTSITGYRDDWMFSTADGDNTALPLLAFDSVIGLTQFSQELQLASKSESKLQWLTGLYYLKGLAYQDTNVWSGVPISAPPNAASLYGRSSIEAYAAFGQASYQITENLKIIGGLRYSYEKRDLHAQQLFGADLRSPAVRTLFGLSPFEMEKTWHSLDPKVTLQYQWEGQMLYGSYSTGFKSGSYNLISVTGPGPLNPEDMTAYEIGGKHDLPFLNGAHLNWAVFLYKYENIQVNVKDPGVGGIAAAQNAAKLENKGFDIDLAIPVTDTLRATFGVEYLDAKYTKFPNASVFNIVNGALDTAGAGDLISVDVSGNRVVRAPKVTVSSQIDWIVPTRIGDFTTTATWYYNSGFYFDPGNIVKQGAYSIINLHLEFAPKDQWWTVAVWCNNVFDETYIQGINQTPFDIGAQYNDPRIIGATLSANF